MRRTTLDTIWGRTPAFGVQQCLLDLALAYGAAVEGGTEEELAAATEALHDVAKHWYATSYPQEVDDQGVPLPREPNQLVIMFGARVQARRLETQARAASSEG